MSSVMFNLNHKLNLFRMERVLVCFSTADIGSVEKVQVS